MDGRRRRLRSSKPEAAAEAARDFKFAGALATRGGCGRWQVIQAENTLRGLGLVFWHRW